MLITTELSNVTKKIQLPEGDCIILIDTTEDESLQKKFGMKNIFRIESDKKILWQVSIAVSGGELKDTFMYVSLNAEGSLSADTFFGFEFVIDIKTGNAKRIGWHK